MSQKDNPFPGINPFFEIRWSGFHTQFIAAIAEALGERLPEDLNARPEGRIVLSETGESARARRADVAVTEPWQTGLTALWPEGGAEGGLTLAEPEIVLEEEVMERRVEIQTASGRLITVIEVLSPKNKSAVGMDAYRQKQHDLLEAGSNLVEIDLLREGRHVMAVSPGNLRRSTGSRGVICVSRAGHPGRREMYCCPLRERLPAIRIPLRPTDADAVLDLQPLIDRIHRIGRYWQFPADGASVQSLTPDEATWVAERLSAAGWE